MKRIITMGTLSLLSSIAALAGSYSLVFQDSIPADAAAVLEQRLGQMLVDAGHTVEADGAPLYIEAADTSWMETPDGQKALVLELSVCDGSVEEIFSLRGVGDSEADAWLRAVKQFLPRSKAARTFAEKLK